METSKQPSGMSGFMIVWAGQLISVLASSMTQFALTIWAYQETGSATALGIISTAFLVPFLLLSPIAGVMVDRYNRKLMMMVSDLTAVTATAGILTLHAFGILEIWHLYIAAVINGLGNTFQWPAYSAAISTMVPKENYSRANGMMSLVESGPAVLAPILAGMLLPIITLTGVLVIDVITFFLAIFALTLVHIPQPEKTVEGQAESGGMLKEALYGFKYIFARRGLFGLLIFFVVLNFVIGISISLFSPFILERTNQSSEMLGIVTSANAIGAVAGGLLIGLWGGFKRRMTSIFLGEALTGLFLLVIFGLGRSLPVWIIGVVIGGIFPIFTNGASQAIWQAKVAPDVQGRVFSARRMIAFSVGPITPIIAGLLADYVTEPMMLGDTWLAGAFGWMVGTTPGSGMALQLVLTGILYMAVVGFTYAFIPHVRNLEDELPDHDQLQKLEIQP
ncbi:MAG TPA: MFS transporter [Anaerolineales bacterium]|nr:MFS transporter [Anaerolineales bacterium]